MLVTCNGPVPFWDLPGAGLAPVDLRMLEKSMVEEIPATPQKPWAHLLGLRQILSGWRVWDAGMARDARNILPNCWARIGIPTGTGASTLKTLRRQLESPKAPPASA